MYANAAVESASAEIANIAAGGAEAAGVEAGAGVDVVVVDVEVESVAAAVVESAALCAEQGTWSCFAVVVEGPLLQG